MAAHSFLTNMKSLGGARTTVATAAENETSSEREPSEVDKRPPPFIPFDDETEELPADGLLHSFHVRVLLPPTFSCTQKINTQLNQLL